MMTDRLIEQIKADREAGTPGPWRIKNCESYGDRCKTFFKEVWNDETDILVTTEVTRAHNDGGTANMRRIARVPDYEARILADAKVIKAAEAKRDADAEVVNAAHALVKLLESPSHSDGELGRYHYDWFVIDQAIYAFNGAMQAQAAILRSYEVPANEARMDEIWGVAQNDGDGDITVGKRKRRTDQGEQR